MSRIHQDVESASMSLATWFAFTIVLLPIIVLPHSVAAIESSRELLSYCQAVERGVTGSGREIEIPATREALLCWGYLEAFQDLSALADPNGNRLLGVCPPEDGTLRDLLRAFVAYASSREAELPRNSAVAVMRALRQAYPCPSASRPPPK